MMVSIAMTPVVRWARLRRPADCGLRVGAWYPVAALSATEVRVYVRGQLVRVARTVVELRARRLHRVPQLPPSGADPRGAAGDTAMRALQHGRGGGVERRARPGRRKSQPFEIGSPFDASSQLWESPADAGAPHRRPARAPVARISDRATPGTATQRAPAAVRDRPPLGDRAAAPRGGLVAAAHAAFRGTPRGTASASRPRIGDPRSSRRPAAPCRTCPRRDS